jgi:hypothetical protein
MTRRLALATLLAAGLLGCELGAKTTREAAAAQCMPVQAACARNADCCSYGCAGGSCQPNPNPGGACKTTDDCEYGMYCVTGGCVVDTGACRADAVSCDYDNHCCSGNCQGATSLTSGSCLPNHAPVIDLGADGTIPYHRTYTLQASGTAGPNTRVYAVSDQDGDTLLYGWTLVVRPPGSAAALSFQTSSSTSFVPDVAGTYVLQLSVTDGYPTQPQRNTATDTVTLTAINTPPAVNAGADVAAASRNFTLVTLSGTVSDPDGDPVTCTWRKTPPGGAAEVVSGPAACTGTTSASFTPGIEGDWTITLEATDGVNTAIDTATVTCVNDPPVVNAGPDRAGNLGPSPGTAPAVSATASFTDRNGDTVEWLWTVDAVPTSPTASQVTSASLVGTTAATVSFVPDVEGDYVLRVRATDPGGLWSEDTVKVTVGRHVADLGYAVSDAVYAKLVNRIVMVGPDASTSGSYIYTLNPASPSSPETSQYLSGRATVVSSSPDATLVAAAGDLDFWWTTLTGVDSSAAHGFIDPFSYGDVVVAGPRRLYLFSSDPGTYNQQRIYAFDPGNASASLTMTGSAGTRGSANPATYPATELFARDPYSSTVIGGGPWMKKYLVSHNGQEATSLDYRGGYQPASCASGPDIWAAQRGDVVFDACGNIYSNAEPPAKLATSLGLSPVHLDSSADGRVVAITAGATSVSRFAADYTAAGTDALPLWGFDGNRNVASAAFVFLSSDGNTRYAIVRAGSGATMRYGLVTFP